MANVAEGEHTVVHRSVHSGTYKRAFHLPLLVSSFLILASGFCAAATTVDLYREAVPSVATLLVSKADGSQALASAFLSLKDGVAITAWHAVKDARRVVARFPSGEEFEVSGLIDKDEKRDVAAIRVKVFGRPLLKLSEDAPPVGMDAFVIGAPKGLEFSVSDGVVSQVHVAEGVKLYQFTCPASPGNSGGPLIGSDGAVYGVVSFQFREGQNLNFAVPSTYVLGLDISLPTTPWGSSALNRQAPDASSGELGHLQVNVNIAAAQVYVNGAYRGDASLGEPLNLPKVGVGEVAVVVSADGYDGVAKQCTLVAKSWTQAAFDMTQALLDLPPPPLFTSRPMPEVEIGLPAADGETVKMVFIKIPAGTFMMGSQNPDKYWKDESPQHRVTISKPFLLGKSEISQSQWEAVMGTRPWRRKWPFPMDKKHARSDPNGVANYISWNNAQKFVRKLNAAAGDSLYRLPTEAEWEYACRAGTLTRWSFGDDKEWAGVQRLNPWGLAGMHDSVIEWCMDRHGEYSSSAQVDPLGPQAGGSRVMRGGRSADRYCRVPESVVWLTDPPDLYGVRLLRRAE
jgi:formylglycine-generating enzyme required for sulfatase activity